MKKTRVALAAIITVVVVALGVVFYYANFNGYKVIDINYHFDYAYIYVPNGAVIEGEIESWTDSADGEQLTITLKDGRTYLTNSVNCLLVQN